MIKRPEERITKVGPQQCTTFDCVICFSANRCQDCKKVRPDPLFEYALWVTLSKNISWDIRGIYSTDLSAHIEWAVNFKRSMIYSTLSRQTKRMTQFHDQNVQLLEIPRDMNECYTWYTQSSSSDIFSVISAGTISENSCFPQFERVAYEWTYESTDNISAYAVAIISSVSIASQKSSGHRF